MKYTDDPEAPEKTREDCAPGQPHVSFSVEVGVDVTFINPTAMNGLFAVTATLADGDSVERVKAKIAKEVKSIKGNQTFAHASINIFIDKIHAGFSLVNRVHCIKLVSLLN